jgi:hypothetical protein
VAETIVELGDEMLRECQTLLHNFSMQAQSADVWLWRLDLDKGYSVRGAYHLLTSHPPNSLDGAAELIWRKQVPLKVFVFAWRLLRDRLATKTNLTHRDIISLEAQSCVAGCVDMESAQHLFVS